MIYNLFISHSWNYPSAYTGLVNLLDNALYFSYKNYSVPKEDPLLIRNSNYYKSEFKNKIKNQMACCSAVLVMAGVYSTYSDFINLEIEAAKELGKPIIAVEPWGSEKTSIVVKNAATKVVGWNTSSIVDAIREVSR